MTAPVMPRSKDGLAREIRRLDSTMPASVLTSWSVPELRRKLADLRAYWATVDPARGAGRRCV